ncbi:MAG: ComEC/Rec2 family competence protein [Deltaproteobacteria bacterium]|nr:ComEC/Rec2 family competence protein [Deltaproteobacteria bacterium]
MLNWAGLTLTITLAQLAALSGHSLVESASLLFLSSMLGPSCASLLRLERRRHAVLRVAALHLFFGCAAHIHASSILPDPALIEVLTSAESDRAEQYGLTEEDSLYTWAKWAGSDELFTGVVAERASRNGSGDIHIVCDGVIRDNLSIRILIRVSDLPWTQESRLDKGDRFSARIKMLSIETRATAPSRLFSREASLARRGVAATARIVALESAELGCAFCNRQSFYARLDASTESTAELGVILAASLAEESMLGDDLRELFLDTGTSHLIVVSGFHISILYGCVCVVAGWAYRRSSMLVTLCPAHCVVPLCGVLCCAWYARFTGSNLPVERALVMLVVLAIGEMLGQRSETFRSLLCSAVVVLLLWPGSFLEPSFQLTFTALGGILTANAWVRRLRLQWMARNPLEAEVRSFGWQLWELGMRLVIAPSLACALAFLATSPVVVMWFGMFHPLSALTNLLVIPLFTVVCVLGGGMGLIAAALALPGGQLLLLSVLKGTGLFLEVLELLRDFGLTGWEVAPEKAPLWAIGLTLLFASCAAPILIQRKRGVTLPADEFSNCLLIRPSEV